MNGAPNFVLQSCLAKKYFNIFMCPFNENNITANTAKLNHEECDLFLDAHKRLTS